MSLKTLLFDHEDYEFDYNRDLSKPNKWYFRLQPIATLVMKIKFSKFEVHGIENVPKDGKLILAANHVSGFDPIVAAYALRNTRELFFMAKDEHFRRAYTKIPLLILNGFPVKRGTADRAAVDYSIRVINSGYGLMIFPQGTRDKQNNRPEKGKSGVALFAREAKCDILPLSINYDKSKSKNRPRVIIRFGQVIPYAELGFSEEIKSRELKDVTKKVMNEIATLWDVEGKLE
ncbi:MAG: lysophospholipid acyltransferase family protein [Oscillospiraceae bacterium]|nr:lysophospholipid acyltransferase family protein [Oscillospiraceae bacterium]